MASNNETNTLRFYGSGVAELVRNGRKWVTIRSELKPYQKDEVVQGHFTNDKTAPDSQSELRILHQEEQPLKDITPGILLLDGFLNPQHAADGLKPYYPDKNWNMLTSAAWTLFMPNSVYSAEPIMDQYILKHPEVKYSDGYTGLTQDHFKFHHLFLTYYYWLVEVHGLSPESYPTELLARELITPHRVSGMIELLKVAKKKRNQEQKSWYLHHFKIADTAEEVGIR